MENEGNKGARQKLTRALATVLYNWVTESGVSVKIWCTPWTTLVLWEDRKWAGVHHWDTPAEAAACHFLN